MGSLGVTEAGVGIVLGAICLPQPYSLPAAARNIGLGSWVGGGSKKFLHPAIAYPILSFIQLLHAH